MEFNFLGKRALVTGAGKGFGRDIAKALLAAGATTFALSRTQSDLDSLKLECPQMNTVCVDLSEWTAAREAVSSISEVDLLVNNAGVLKLGSFLEVAEEQFDVIYSTNVKAVVNVSQVVAKDMIARQSGGAIVNVSSLTSEHGFPNVVAYSTSKAALDQLTRCMAVELAPHKIRVNSVQPTVALTQIGEIVAGQPGFMEAFIAQTPLGRLSEVNEITRPVLFLLSDEASSMMNGAFLHIDGGFHCT